MGHIAYTLYTSISSFGPLFSLYLLVTTIHLSSTTVIIQVCSGNTKTVENNMSIPTNGNYGSDLSFAFFSSSLHLFYSCFFCVYIYIFFFSILITDKIPMAMVHVLHKIPTYLLTQLIIYVYYPDLIWIYIFSVLSEKNCR